MALTPELEQFIQHQVASGKYASADAVIVAALQLLAAQALEDRSPAVPATLSSQPVGEHRVYRVGPTLVVESEPIGDLEAVINQLREERMESLIADYENSV